jgi:putative tryptophan/tyrosine transport system substrate-binding protein
MICPVANPQVLHQTERAILSKTKTIPIVFLQVTDPVGSGFVASLGRPGGNVTGFVTFNIAMARISIVS